LVLAIRLDDVMHVSTELFLGLHLHPLHPATRHLMHCDLDHYVVMETETKTGLENLGFWQMFFGF